MKTICPSHILILIFGILCVLTLPAQETVCWSGLESVRWDDSANWDGWSVPDSSSEAIFDRNGKLGGPNDLMVAVENSVTGSLTVDRPEWTLRPVGAGSGVLDVAEGKILFTEAFVADAETVEFFGGVLDRNLRIRFGGTDALIVNNGTGVVVFDAAGKKPTGLGLSSIGNTSVNLLLNGSGDFVFRNGTVFPGIARFGTAPGFSGEFRIEGGVLGMERALNARGGLLRVTPEVNLKSHLNLIIGDNEVDAPAVADFRGVTAELTMLFGFGTKAVLRVDGQTDLTFKWFNGGNLSIEGFVKGATRLRIQGLKGVGQGQLRVNGSPVSLFVDPEGNLVF